MYEHRSHALLPTKLFYRRVAMHFLAGSSVLLAVLGIGMAGYMAFAEFSAMDSFLNAAMLLGGMGPVGELPNDAAKFFAGCYALFSGIVFIGVTSVLIAPFAHRVLHTLHLKKQ